LAVIPMRQRPRFAHSSTDKSAPPKYWLDGDKSHPLSGEPLQIQQLEAPPATVALMWTHAAHGVNPCHSTNTRECVVYAYRNHGSPSAARWITEAFEKKSIPGAEGLSDLY
jgi:hypothetical protein